jgi:hypothetical protein
MEWRVFVCDFMKFTDLILKKLNQKTSKKLADPRQRTAY